MAVSGSVEYPKFYSMDSIADRVQSVHYFWVAPMSHQLTCQDLRLLEKYRIQRLRQLFPKTLGLCLLKLDNNDTLRVHCPEPWLVDRIIDDADHLLDSTRQTLGVRHISLYYAGEEVYKTKARRAKSISA